MTTLARGAVAALLLTLALASPTAARAAGLTKLDGPKGGTIVYGPVLDASTMPLAIGQVLRTIHAQFGVRPEVGKPFATNGSGSTAVTFSLPSTSRGPVAGMVIVAPAERGFEAGVVFDDASRLATSFDPMVQTLLASWHPRLDDATPSPASMPPAAGGSPLPLRPHALPDRTASVAIPDGWTIGNGSGGGTIFVTGPRGETIALGYPFLVVDTSSANGRRLQQQATTGSLRNTSYAKNLYYPYGQPLAKTFVDLITMERARNRMPATTMRITSEEPSAISPGARCARFRGDAVADDGRGPVTFETTFCARPPSGAASMWMAYANHAALPTPLAREEGATLTAIVASFRTDNAAVQQMADRIAAPEIARIHEIGRQATLRSQEADRTRIATRQAYEARSASQDRQSKAFSDYMLGHQVVVDRDRGTHTTEWNNTADALVKHDPNRYGYVQTKDFWKGVDY